MTTSKGKKLAVLGAGKMGETLISGMLDVGVITRDRVVATAKHAERLDTLKDKYKIAVTTNNRKAVRGAGVVLLAVKPQAVKELLEEIRGELSREQVVISVVASVTTAFLERNLNAPIPVIRAMPNTPCLLRSGMTALCKGVHAEEQQLKEAQRMFDSVGRTLILDEKYMDAVTGLSASGPAFMYIIIESLAEAGVKVGLPRSVATELAAQMTLGSAKMVLETREHPALLKDIVTTPAGCTIDGILELEEGKLRVTLIKAVVKATQRASELLEN
ncbi:MAG: pyrroline-5-carboxylate reductase [Acidobacteria bacterium]|nr:pyrroline-5-carboxylate reductase [Acidobacteriota bacterium]